jgi:hypothetical protein
VKTLQRDNLTLAYAESPGTTSRTYPRVTGPGQTDPGSPAQPIPAAALMHIAWWRAAPGGVPLTWAAWSEKYGTLRRMPRFPYADQAQFAELIQRD